MLGANGGSTQGWRAALAAAVVCGLLSAPAQGDVGALPQTGTAITDGPVYAIAQAPGRTYIGGAFTHVGPRTGAGVQIGAADHLLRTGMPEVAGGSILAVAADGAGGWFVGGSFTSVADQPRARLVHVRADGSLDPWDPEPDGDVEALTVATVAGSRVLYVGGAFNRIRIHAGSPTAARAKLAAFSAPSAGADVGDGLAWNPGIATSTPGTRTDVRSLAVAPVSVDVAGVPTEMPLVFAAGGFDRAGSQGNAAGGAAALWGPGAQDPSGAAPSDPLAANLTGPFTVSGTVQALALGGTRETTVGTGRYDDATLYVATNSPPAAADGIPTGVLRALKIHVVGRAGAGETAGAVSAAAYTNDWNAMPACTTACGLVIRTLLTSVVPNGDGTSTTTVYAGGDFAQMAGDIAQGVAALVGVSDPAGTGQAAGLLPGFKNGATSGVSALALGGGRLYAGGTFDSIRHEPVARVAQLDAASGDLASGWDAGLAGGNVLALGATTDAVYAGGSFSSANTLTRSGLAALDAAGHVVTDFSPAADGPVRALAMDGDRLLVGGEFSLVSGLPRAGLAAIGANGTPTAWDPHPVSSCAGSGCTPPPVAVLALAAPAGGPVYVGGQFSTIGGASRHDIAAVDPSSGAATAWDPGADGVVQTLLPACGAVFAGGSFTHLGGSARARIGALDPSSGAALPFDPEANSAVYGLALGDGVLYAAGQFSQIGGQPRARLAALDPAGGAATGFNPAPDGPVYAVGFADGRVFAGGNFLHIGADPRRDLAAIDPQTGAASAWRPDPDDQVRALRSDGSLLAVGGLFTDITTRAQRGVATFALTTGSAARCPDPPAPPADNTPPPPPPPPPPTVEEPETPVQAASYTPPPQPAPKHYPPPRDTTAPVLRDVFATGHRIVLGRKSVTVGYSLSEAGRLHVTIQRRELMPCPLKLTSHGARRRHDCHRYTRRGGFDRTVPAGPGRLELDGAGLAPGRYRAVVVATDRAGNYSRAVQIRLLILR